MIDGLNDGDALTTLCARSAGGAAPLSAVSGNEVSPLPNRYGAIDAMADRQRATEIAHVLRRASGTILNGPVSLLMA